MQFTTQLVTKWLRLAQSQNTCECVCWHIYTGYKNIRKKSNIILQFATFSQNGHDLPSWQLVLILLVTHRLCKLPVYFNITLPLFLYLLFLALLIPILLLFIGYASFPTQKKVISLFLSLIFWWILLFFFISILG